MEKSCMGYAMFLSDFVLFINSEIRRSDRRPRVPQWKPNARIRFITTFESTEGELKKSLPNNQVLWTFQPSHQIDLGSSDPL